MEKDTDKRLYSRRADDRNQCNPREALFWKAAFGLVSFLLCVCLTLIGVSYSGLVREDNKNAVEIKQQDNLLNATCSRVGKIETKVDSLEKTSDYRMAQLQTLENKISKALAILERLDKISVDTPITKPSQIYRY